MPHLFVSCIVFLHVVNELSLSLGTSEAAREATQPPALCTHLPVPPGQGLLKMNFGEIAGSRLLSNYCLKRLGQGWAVAQRLSACLARVRAWV